MEKSIENTDIPSNHLVSFIDNVSAILINEVKRVLSVSEPDYEDIVWAAYLISDVEKYQKIYPYARSWQGRYFSNPSKLES